MPSTTDILIWIPILVVWLAGALVAIGRWSRQPAVSLLVLSSVTAMLAVAVVNRIGFSLLHGRLNSGLEPQDVGLYLGILGIVMLPIRIAAWAALLVAIFGWRQSVQPGQTRPAGFQFSIRSVMLVTLAVALFCAAGRGLAVLLGDAGGVLILLDEVPILICWLIGIWLAVARFSDHLGVSQVAAAGFALSFAGFLTGLVPWFWALASGWHNMTLISISSLATALLMTAAWILLIVAALGWRPVPREAPPAVV